MGKEKGNKMDNKDNEHNEFFYNQAFSLLYRLLEGKEKEIKKLAEYIFKSLKKTQSGVDLAEVEGVFKQGFLVYGTCGNVVNHVSEKHRIAPGHESMEKYGIYWDILAFVKGFCYIESLDFDSVFNEVAEWLNNNKMGPFILGFNTQDELEQTLEGVVGLAILIFNKSVEQATPEQQAKILGENPKMQRKTFH